MDFARLYGHVADRNDRVLTDITLLNGNPIKESPKVCLFMAFVMFL